mgnify:CR=1 FL=1
MAEPIISHPTTRGSLSRPVAAEIRMRRLTQIVVAGLTEQVRS